MVRMVSHEDKLSQMLGFYHGHKESEKITVRAYLVDSPPLKRIS